jgi:hypothetical protein
MTVNALFTFDIQTKMTSDQAITEMHSKTVSSDHPHKSVIQVMICITMVYETVCSTTHSVATATARVYIPHTFAEYEALIDRAAHAAYILVALDAAMPVPDPFNLNPLRLTTILLVSPTFSYQITNGTQCILLAARLLFLPPR